MTAPEIAQVVMDADTVTTITNNINSLYSNALSQLTSYTMGVVALVGVLIPALVTFIQWRSLKAEKENLEKHIAEEITKAKLAIRDDLETELKQLVESVESSMLCRFEEKSRYLEKKLECADAATFHLQGNSQLDNKYYQLAARDYCFATERYLRGDDELNGQRTLDSLIQNCLPYINKVEYEDDDLEESIGHFYKSSSIFRSADGTG